MNKLDLALNNLHMPLNHLKKNQPHKQTKKSHWAKFGE